jgi:hypothetical protein
MSALLVFSYTKRDFISRKFSSLNYPKITSDIDKEFQSNLKEVSKTKIHLKKMKRKPKKKMMRKLSVRKLKIDKTKIFKPKIKKKKFHKIKKEMPKIKREKLNITQKKKTGPNHSQKIILTKEEKKQLNKIISWKKKGFDTTVLENTLKSSLGKRFNFIKKKLDLKQ